eukprot:6028176-Alexandrium_andersonii.AAC.1
MLMSSSVNGERWTGAVFPGAPDASWPELPFKLPPLKVCKLLLRGFVNDEPALSLTRQRIAWWITAMRRMLPPNMPFAVSYTHLRAHETSAHL